jgi:hypothetical protein
MVKEHIRIAALPYFSHLQKKIIAYGQTFKKNSEVLEILSKLDSNDGK